MQTIKDKNGREWILDVNFTTMKRVKETLGIDLLKVTGESSEVDSVVTLIDTLYVLCKPEADKLGMTDEQFGRSFDCEFVEEAHKALVYAIADFLPSARAKLLREAFDRINTAQNTALAAVHQKIREATDVDFNAILRRALEPAAQLNEATKAVRSEIMQAADSGLQATRGMHEKMNEAAAVG